MRAWAVVACIIAGLIAVICWQRSAMSDQSERLTKIEIERDALSQSVDKLRAWREEDRLAVLQSAQQAERMTVKNKTLEYRLQEALRAEADFNRVLSRGVTDALCLRYQSATGVYGGDPGDSTGRTHAGESNTAAAGCASWAGLTVRGAVEWAGLLLDHAGLERIDKQAIREWTRRTQNLGASEVSQ